MKPHVGTKSKRGTTLVEVLIAMALMLLVFLFLTADLIQSSQAENLASNHTGTIAAADYLLAVVKNDSFFWKPGHWAAGPGSDPCKTAWAGYTDDITKPTWHPMCGLIFPEATAGSAHFNYMWNAQLQAGDPNVAQVTMWVETDEGGRQDIFALRTSKTQNAPQAANSPVVPTNPPPTSPPPTTPPPSGTPKPTPSPKPSPSPTPTPSKTPTPSPSPSGVFE